MEKTSNERTLRRYGRPVEVEPRFVEFIQGAFRSGITPVPGFWTRHGSNIIAGIVGAAFLRWIGLIAKTFMTIAKRETRGLSPGTAVYRLAVSNPI
jgi:hypothetical protein